MAPIAEDLLLLLLDNASGRPALARDRRQRLLGAAVLLDLAFACRVRLSFEGEPTRAGRLLQMAGADLADPILDPALHLMGHRAWKPHTAVLKLGRGVEPALLTCLERTGHIRQVRLRAKRSDASWAWPMVDRSRVDEIRAALFSALFDLRTPAPTTAGIISLLHHANEFTALLSLNDRGRRWVDWRAGDIAGGCWLDEGEDESPRDVPYVNLAVMTSAVRPALT
ncbi:MAG: hypothetical protein QOH57_2587 [Mycobacterium sp.]|jgi:hypothetical protein|nr:hypothetical protein [Mycobacterium sp.]